MPARDHFHYAVRNALQRDGWVIIADPLTVRYDDIDLHVDLGAEKLLTAQKGTQKIAVEIKSFIGASFIADFHLALGQFLNYRLALEAEKPDYTLYLAVPEDVYEGYFKQGLVRAAVRRYALKLLVYHVESEEVVLWIS